MNILDVLVALVIMLLVVVTIWALRATSNDIQEWLRRGGK